MAIHGQDIIEDRFALTIGQALLDKLQILGKQHAVKHVDFPGSVTGNHVGLALWRKFAGKIHFAKANALIGTYRVKKSRLKRVGSDCPIAGQS